MKSTSHEKSRRKKFWFPFLLYSHFILFSGLGLCVSASLCLYFFVFCFLLFRLGYWLCGWVVMTVTLMVVLLRWKVYDIKMHSFSFFFVPFWPLFQCLHRFVFGGQGRLLQWIWKVFQLRLTTAIMR